MAGGSDKSIRVTFIVDDQSVMKAKRAISDVTAAVKALVSETQKVNLGFGGGGGGGFGGVSAASNQPGISATQQIQNKVAGAGGGALDGITKAAQNSSLLFKGAAAGSKDAFKSMSDGLKAYVDQADSQVLRLQRSLKTLEDSWNRVNKASNGASGGGGGGGGGGSGGGGSGGGGFPGGSGGGPNDLSTPTSRLGNWMSQPFGGQGARGWLNNSSFGQGVNQLASNVPGYGMMASFGIPGAIAAGVGGTALMALGARNSNQVANVNYEIAKNTFSSNAKATIGDVYGGNALALHKFDYARSHAMSALTNSNELAGLNGTGMDDLLRTRRDQSHRVGIIDNLAAGSVGGAAKGFFSEFGSRAANLFGTESGINVGTTNAQQIARDQAAGEQIALKPQMLQQLIENKMREDPMYNDRLNEVTGNAFGTLGLARASGVSNQIRTLKSGDRISGTTMLDAFAKSKGFEGAGSIVSGMQEMGGTVGRGFMSGGSGVGLMNIQAGGLGNAAQLMAMGSQFSGNGGYGSFMKNIQGQIGGKDRSGLTGVDITAASHITGLGASAMSAGSFAGTGEGLMTSMLDAGNTGSIGGDMRMARNMAGGMAAMGAVASGGLDPLQQALNASAAMQAAPGASFGTKQALMKMDPATAMDALRNNRVPQELANMGVTLEMLKKYVSTQDATAFGRVSASMLAGTGAGAEVERYKKAGGLSYLKGMSRKDQQAAIGRLAGGLVTAGGAADYGSARARLSLQLASRGFSGKRKKGSGSHSAASLDTIEGEVAADHTGETYDTGKKNAAEDFAYGKDVSERSRNKDNLDRARAASQKGISGGTAEEAISGVASALTAFVAVLKNINNGPVKVGAPQAKGK